MLLSNVQGYTLIEVMTLRDTGVSSQPLNCNKGKHLSHISTEKAGERGIRKLGSYLISSKSDTALSNNLFKR